MKTLILCFLISASAFASNNKYPFCNLSISTAPGEDGAIENYKRIQYSQNLKINIPKETYAANKDFFKQLGHDCLTMGEIKIRGIQETFTVYNTAKDECDGGNTFGIVVSNTSHERIADIGDGFISCK